MPYAEYIKPNPEIKKDLLIIKEIGTTDSAITAIAERVLGVREFIKKWEGRIGRNLMDKMFKLLAYEIKEVGGKPSMPITSGYDFTNIEDVERFVKDAHDSFRRLEEYLRSREGTPVEDESTPFTRAVGGVVQKLSPVDIFVQMTADLDQIIMGVEPVENYRFRCGDMIYNIQPSAQFGGRSIVELDAKDVEKAKEISRQGQNAKEDHRRFIYHDEVDIFEKEPEEKVEGGSDYEQPADDDENDKFPADDEGEPVEKTVSDEDNQTFDPEDMKKPDPEAGGEADKEPEKEFEQPTEKCDTDNENGKVPDNQEEGQESGEEPDEEAKPEGVDNDTKETEGSVSDGGSGFESEPRNPKRRKSNKKKHKGSHRK